MPGELYGLLHSRIRGIFRYLVALLIAAACISPRELILGYSRALRSAITRASGKDIEEPLRSFILLLVASS